MICLVCRRVDIVHGFTSVSFERGELSFVVKNVPARICPHCGEAFVEEKVAAQLLRGAEGMSRGGMYESSIEYESIAWDIE